jgi:uncharacterized coiled-coil DUF342 family protein
MPQGRQPAPEEIQNRVAILKRFRELLVAQRSKFADYLEVLEREKADIESGNVDALVSHVEIEQAIVSEIFTFQKVIDPLEDMYRAAYHAEEVPADIPRIKERLEELKAEVVSRNAENRALLKQRMTMLRQEIQGLRNPFKRGNQVYGGPGPSIVDIKG